MILRILFFCFGLTVAPAFALNPLQVGERQAIPFNPEPTPIESHGLRVGLVILALLGGVGSVVLLSRRMGLGKFAQLGYRRPRRIQVLERARLSAHCSIYILQIDNREIVLGQCDGELTQIYFSSGPDQILTTKKEGE